MMEPRSRQDPPGVQISPNGASARHLRPVRGASDDTPPVPVIDARGYEALDDPVELRIALRELHRVRAWIGQFADLAAEMPGFAMESVRAAKANAAMVTLLIERAETRLRILTERAPAGVVVIDPTGRPAAEDSGGVVFLPVVTGPAVRATGLSSATLILDVGEASTPEVYPDCDVIVIALSGAAELVWWDDRRVVHRTSHRPTEHAYIRQGTPHCMVNTGAVPMVAVQVRATAEVMAGTALPDLAADLPAAGSAGDAGAVAAG
ncbi:MAG TPA: cupin domain-containing protein [Pseudonocardiaceae bacterium]